MTVIVNGANIPLNIMPNGTFPDVSGAPQDYYQPMVFEPVGKVVNGFQVNETGSPINFMGVIQPFTERQLLLKPEGQRAWSWYWVQSTPALNLKVDDAIVFQGKQFRVMAKKDQKLTGFVEYQMITDYSGSGPA